MVNRKEFEDWCRKIGRQPDKEIVGEDNPHMDPDRYFTVINCGRDIRYNESHEEVSGELEAIDFMGDGQIKGDKIILTNAEWYDMDEGRAGKSTLTVEDSDYVGLTVSGWRY